MVIFHSYVKLPEGIKVQSSKHGGFGKRQIRTSAWWEARAEPHKRQHMAMETLR